MKWLHGTYQQGKVLLDVVVDWPDGTRVSVCEPDKPSSAHVEDRRVSPQEIHERLARWDATEPLDITPEDEAEIEAAREEFRRVSLDAVRRRMGLVP